LDDRELGVSQGTTVFRSRKITQGHTTWEKLVTRLKRSKEDRHSFDEYMALDKQDQLKIKDAAGFLIGGRFQHNERLKTELLYRDVLTLDLDHLTSLAELFDLRLALEGIAWVLYSTHKHTEASPRLRLVIPLDEQTKPEVYEVIGRVVADAIGIDYFDDTTYQASRVMFYPSHAKGSTPYFEMSEGEPLPVDTWIDSYGVALDDPRTWPVSSREDTPTLHGHTVEWAPGKRGAIGAFCRAYTIPEAITEFGLPYEPVGDHDERYSYLGGSSAEGAVVYDDWTQLYSNHESDPAYGYSRNAFDLVRIHRFGELDSMHNPDSPAEQHPSFQAMTQMIQADERVLAEIDDAIDAAEEFVDVSDGTEPARIGVTLPGAPGGITSVETQDMLNQVKNAQLVQFERQDKKRRQDNGERLAKIDDEVAQVEAVDPTKVHRQKMTAFASLMLDVRAAAPLDRDSAKKLVGRAALLTLDNTDIDILAGEIRQAYGGMKPTAKSVKEQLRNTKAAINTDDMGRLLVNEVLKHSYFGGGAKLKRYAKVFWIYRLGWWAQVEEEMVKGIVQEAVRDLHDSDPADPKLKVLVADIRDKGVELVVSAMWDGFKSDMAARERDDMDPLRLMMRRPLPLINCANGELHFKYDGSYEMRPHSPENFLTAIVPVEFDPVAAECPRFEAFLDHIFRDCLEPEEMKRHVYELIGYIIGGSRWLKAWILFHGETNTGKSTLLSVIQHLLGAASLAQSLSTYGQNKSNFAETVLLGVLLLADDDFDKNGSLPDGFLKKISEEKQISSEIKFGGIMTFIARSLPLICANHWPVTRDVSTAFRERAMVFHFPTAFEGAERSDRERDLMMEELPGILAGAVLGLSRLRARGDWDTPMDCRAAKTTWENNSNALMMWLEECTERRDGHGETGFLNRADAWTSFRRWAEDANTIAMKKGEFFLRVEQVLGEAQKTGGVHGWSGRVVTKYHLGDGSSDFEG
jgi:P4 family phage/plasmid primase-like protien